MNNELQIRIQSNSRSKVLRKEKSNEKMKGEKTQVRSGRLKTNGQVRRFRTAGFRVQARLSLFGADAVHCFNITYCWASNFKDPT